MRQCCLKAYLASLCRQESKNSNLRLLPFELTESGNVVLPRPLTLSIQYLMIY